MNEYARVAVEDLLRRAVVTDGGLHKQWFLEEIAAYLLISLPEHEKGVPA